MNTTFKKTLVASAILAFAGAAQAATLAPVSGTNAAPSTASTEYLGLNTSVLTTGFNITLGAEYSVGDVITITFNTDALDPATASTTIVVPTVTGKKGLTLGLIEQTSAKLVYRVTALDGPAADSTVGVVIPVVGTEGTNQFKFNAAKVLAAGTLKAAFAAQTSTGLNLDTAGGNDRSATLLSAKSQFKLTTTRFASIIDVNADRKRFVARDTSAIGGASGDTSKDFAILAVVVEPTDLSAVPGKVSVSVKGDFSWMIDSNTTTEGLQPKAGVVTISGCPAAGVGDTTENVVIKADEIAFRCAVAGYAVPQIVLDIAANNAGLASAQQVVLAPTDFTATVSVPYTSGAQTGTATLASAGNAGLWKLNGSQVRVPYMVLQNGRFSSILNVTNHGSKEGAISIDVFDEAGTKVASNYPAGTSKPGSVVSVATAARNALLDAGKDLSQVTKFSVQIVTNVPENDVIVYAAYADSQNGGERAIVNNDSKVQTKVN